MNAILGGLTFTKGIYTNFALELILAAFTAIFWVFIANDIELNFTKLKKGDS